MSSPYSHFLSSYHLSTPPLFFSCLLSKPLCSTLFYFLHLSSPFLSSPFFSFPFLSSPFFSFPLLSSPHSSSLLSSVVQIRGNRAVMTTGCTKLPINTLQKNRSVAPSPHPLSLSLPQADQLSASSLSLYYSSLLLHFYSVSTLPLYPLLVKTRSFSSSPVLQLFTPAHPPPCGFRVVRNPTDL